MNRMIIAFICLLCITTVSARTFKTPVKPIALKKGESEFTIVLNSNPSTGFAWYFSPNLDDILTLKSHKYSREASAKPGSPGEESWTFKVATDRLKAPLIFNLSFVYIRAWEPDKPESAQIVVLTP